jgi:anti-sigma B factor antagonist
MMILESKKVNNVTLISLLVDRLDAARALDFKEKIAVSINQGTDQIVLDFSAVKFMDSTGLGSLVSVLKMLGGKKELVLCGVKGMLLDLFKLTRMDRVFVILDSEADAIKKLSN